MRVLIIGAGGHAQVIADILLQMQTQNRDIILVGYVDDDSTLFGKTLVSLPVLGTVTQINQVPHDVVVVALGNNQVRHQLATRLVQQGEQLFTACHPHTVIASDVFIGAGSMICAGVIVNTGAQIGSNVILNTGCSVDHHSQVGDGAHIAPGVRLGGQVTVGQGALIGIGATVMPRCHIGDWSTIGAGACVTKSVPPGLTVVGVPAKPLEKR